MLGLTALLGSSAPSVGAAQRFPGQGFLPDNRAWEMVSPPEKNGGEVMGESTRTRAAVDGSAVGFVSFSAFAGALGTGLTVDYMGVRGASGWSSHAITPPQNPTTADTIWIVGYDGALSEDLSHGVFRAFSPLTDEPNVADTRNLYLRDDLRVPGSGHYRLLTDSTTLQPAPDLVSGVPVLADASEDFSRVIFESTLNLTSDASGEMTKLYEWDDGLLRLAGILPDSACASPPCPASSSSAGRGATGPGFHYTLGTISDDGSRVFFSSPVEATGDLVDDSQLYMRVDGLTTVRLNASENDTPAPIPSGAVFDLATPDGSKVFFESNEQLTNTPGSGLYMYDTSKPDSAPDNLTLIANASILGIAGVSDDGSYVYFLSTAQLAPGAAASSDNLYAWHQGTVRYIGSFSDPEDSRKNTTRGIYTLLGYLKGSRISRDGSKLVFTSRTGQNFTGYDHGSSCGAIGDSEPCNQIYLYDALADSGAGELICLSCRPDGGPATADGSINTQVGNGVLGPSQYLNRAVSDDGRYVFFTSGERLVAADQNGLLPDVYSYDTQADELHLLSSGKSTSGSYFADASADGADAFFITREPLSGWDVDSGYDLYDARVGGGLPEPPPAPPSCQGDACQPAPVALNDPTPGTSTLSGPGNVAARKARRHRRCPRGKRPVKVRGKARCVKKASGKRRRADHERRVSR